MLSLDVVDLGSGNVRSVCDALSFVRVPHRRVHSPDELRSRTILLPGVGSAGYYTARLVRSGFRAAILDHVAAGGRLVGICLGFQLMAEGTEEDGGVEGLGLLPGAVRRLGGRHPRTHNGWEQLTFDRRRVTDDRWLGVQRLTRRRVLRGRVFYNHEYGHVRDTDDPSQQAVNDTDLAAYTAMVVRGNLIGMQFHPEKSQRTGLALLAMVL